MHKTFTADSLLQIQYLSYPSISADGQWLACVQSAGDENSGLFSSFIRLYDLRHHSDVLWPVHEGESRKQPRFLPGGRLLYLSSMSGAWQLYMLDLATMESRQLSTARHGVIRYSASDDGAHIVYEATLWPEETDQGLHLVEMLAAERTAFKQELDMRPYYVTNLTYKMDKWYGMRHGEYSHLCTVTLEGEQHLIDTNGVEAVWPAISHKGERIAFYGYPHDGARGQQVELMTCRYDGAELRILTDGLGLYEDHCPQFMQDDLHVICGAYPAYEDGSTIMMPYRVDLASGDAEPLMQEGDESICHGLSCMAANRTEYGDATQYFRLTNDDRYLYFLSAFHGVSNIYRVNIKERGRIEIVIPGDSDLQAFDMLPDGSSLACLMANAQRPAELYLDGEQLTDVNGWLREYACGDVEECWCTGRDGKTRLQYYMVYPVGYRQGMKVPTVLYIKGGPETIYLKSYWHQFQALANRGFAVICGNPRGSVGYGRAFCAGGVCWGNEAMEDLLDMVEDAVRRGIADPAHIGVTGGSYGGYMTNKLIGRTRVFTAAVTQRSLVNPATSYGTGDMGFVSSREVPADFRMMDYLEDRARGNIISYVDNMKTPLLILHSFQDYRCSYEQAEQLFIPMKERNPEVPLRMVVFPNENHGLTRTGQPGHQQRHLTELLDWFSKYLDQEEETRYE